MISTFLYKEEEKYHVTDLVYLHIHPNSQSNHCGVILKLLIYYVITSPHHLSRILNIVHWLPLVGELLHKLSALLGQIPAVLNDVLTDIDQRKILVLLGDITQL